MNPRDLVKYLMGGATALLLIWVGSIVVSQLMVAIVPLLFMVLAVGFWWDRFFGGRR
ncbi:hypothetical protein MXD62_33500 [Frankia sp. Mgl5]|uniref:hypothetical protein n=1 Tax=Frankia sp. Mgl5 TaxID=2933793 RepID=UPI00200BB121|nr:hypothetical protein [Frankia sp. Mgl5]MCK9931997.1 hypothetical protein [Frankia sp. Mgl5]